MIRKDDRTPEQKQTHRLAVVARDKFMSGWGDARGHGGTPFGERGNGVSRCAWACAPSVNVERVERWVRSRSEMKYVTVVDLSTYRPPRNTAHFHIYVANADHPGATY